jgi:hypothetical protein
MLLFLTTSCGKVYFSSPQPANGKVVKVFDNKIQGFYSDSILDVKVISDSIWINNQSFKLTAEMPGEDQALVKLYKDFYFVSLSDSIYFTVFMASFYDDKLAIYMLNPDQRSIETLKRVVDVKTLDEGKASYLITPSKKEFNDVIDWELFDLVCILKRQKG